MSVLSRVLSFFTFSACQIFCGKKTTVDWYFINTSETGWDDASRILNNLTLMETRWVGTFTKETLIVNYINLLKIFPRLQNQYLLILTRYVTLVDTTSFSSRLKSWCPDVVWLLLRLLEDRLRWFLTNSCCHCWHWYCDWDSNMTEHNREQRVPCFLWHLHGRPQDKRLLCQIFSLGNVPEIFF